jgi:hypothetical protein
MNHKITVEISKEQLADIIATLDESAKACTDIGDDDLAKELRAMKKLLMKHAHKES